jgi:site-specific recombinase XerD
MRKSKKSILEHIPDFFEYLDIEKGLSFKSQETYSRFLQRFAYWLKKNNLSNLLPHQLTEKHIWQYRLFLSHYLKKDGKLLKRSTQNHYLVVLRSFLKYLADRDIASLPVEKVKLSREKTERAIKFLNLDQIKKILQAPDTLTKIGLRDKAILETLFSTGLRVGELVSLNREQIKITPQTQDLEIVIIGKGGKPRPIYFSKRAIKWLKKYLQIRKDKEKALFINYKGPKNNSRLSSRSIENIVKKYAILAGIPSFTTPHVIRHSFATDLLMQGVDLREIQEFLGHKNIATTQIYAHVTSKKLRDLHRKFHSGRKI